MLDPPRIPDLSEEARAALPDALETQLRETSHRNSPVSGS